MALGDNNKLQGTQLNNNLSVRLASTLGMPAPDKIPTSYSYKNLGSINNMPSTVVNIDFDKYNPLIPTNNPNKVVEHQKQQLGFGLNDVPERKSPSLANGLMTVLDLMQRPQYAVTNVLSDITDDKKDSLGDVIKGAFQGITGERKSSTTDVMDNLGWKNDDKYNWYGKSKYGDDWNFSNTLRNALGLVGDVVLDPTTYLGAGLITKGSAKLAGKEIAEKAVKQVSGTTADVASRIATALGKSMDDVIKTTSKFGESQDFVLRLAHELGDVNNLSKTNVDTINYILDKGLDSVNQDIISGATGGLKNVATKLEDALKLNQQSRMGSVSQMFGKTLNAGDDLNVHNLLKSADINEFNKGQNVIRDLIDVFDPTNPRVYDSQMKNDILQRVYDVDYLDPSFIDYYPDSTVGVIETLVNAFGDVPGGKILDKADEIIEAQAKYAKKTKGSTKGLDNLLDTLNTETRTVEKMKKVKDGIEFQNGLIHQYDKASKTFNLNYHNPFTGTVKPLMNMTNVVQSEAMRKATKRVVELDVVRGVGDIIGYLFQPEHIRLALKNNPEVYQAGKHFASKVTDFMHKETALAKQALRSATLPFQNNKAFLESKKLRTAAITYMQRENDDFARATWAYITGMSEEAYDPKMLEALELLKQNKKWVKKYSNLMLDGKDILELQDIGGKIQIFNDSILNFDNNNGIVFGDNSAEAMALTQENTSKYVHQVYRGNPSDLAVINATKTIEDSVSKRTSSFMASTKNKKFQSVAMQEAMNPDLDAVDDIISSMALRNHESLCVELNKQIISTIDQDMLDMPGLSSLMAKQSRAGLIPMSFGDTTYFVHPDIKNQMSRIANTFFDNPGQQKVIEYIDNLTNIMKTTQTSLNPSFIIKNWIGEPMMNWFAGVKVKSHKTAYDIMSDMSGKDLGMIGDTMFFQGKPVYRKTVDPKTGQSMIEYISKESGEIADTVGKRQLVDGVMSKEVPPSAIWDTSVSVNPEAIPLSKFKADVNTDFGVKTYKIGQYDLNALDIMKIFEEEGLGWSGISKGNLIQNMEKTLKQEVLKDTGTGLKALKNSAVNSGDFVETWTRLAQFIDRLESGMSVKNAAADVRLYHVDYRNLTNIESNYFRRLMPYYTYMRKNLPMQMRMVYAQHGKVKMISHLVDSSYEAINRDYGSEIATDDYLKEGMAIPMSVDENGNVQYLNWNLPLADLSRLKYNMGDFMTSNVVDMLHPLIRGGLELSSNMNMKFQQPIEKYEGERAPILPGVTGDTVNLPGLGEVSNEGLPKKVDYAVQQFGVVNSLRKALGQGINDYNGVEDPLKPRNPLTYALLSSVLPLRNQQATLNNQAYEYRDQLQEYILKMKREGVEVPSWTPQVRSPSGFFTPPREKKR